MIYLIISFITVVATGFFIQWKNFKKNYDSKDKGFELTEFVQKTPTPTPIYEKKKRGRKSKTTK
jgi:hypothetical protein